MQKAVTVHKIEQLGFGTTEVTLSILGETTTLTRFPEHWDAAMRKAKVEESLRNLIAPPKSIANKPNKFEVIGRTSEGIAIRSHINIKSRKIMTTFVDGKEMKKLYGTLS